MSKKIYSFLLGGAVALAAFAATEFVGNGTVGKNDMIEDYKPIFAEASASVTDQTITVTYDLSSNAQILIHNQTEWETVVAADYGKTNTNIVVKCVVNGVTKTETKTAGSTGSFTFENLAAGTYPVSLTAYYDNNPTTVVSYTIEDQVIENKVPENLYLVYSAGTYCYLTLDKQADGTYMGEFPTGTAAFSFNISEVSNSRTKCYAPTAAGATTITFGTDLSFVPASYSNSKWSDNYWTMPATTTATTVVVDLTAKTLKVTKEPEMPAYLGITNLDSQYVVNKVRLNKGSEKGIYTTTLDIAAEAKDVGWSDAEIASSPDMFKILFTATVDGTPTYYTSADSEYDIANSVELGKEYDLQAGAWSANGWNLFGLGEVDITVDLNNKTVTFSKEEPVPVYANGLDIINNANNASLGKLVREGETNVYSAEVTLPTGEFYLGEGSTKIYAVGEGDGAINGNYESKMKLYKSSTDYPWSVIKAGKYEMSVDVKTLDITLTKLPEAPAHLYMLGEDGSTIATFNQEGETAIVSGEYLYKSTENFYFIISDKEGFAEGAQYLKLAANNHFESADLVQVFDYTNKVATLSDTKPAALNAWYQNQMGAYTFSINWSTKEVTITSTPFTLKYEAVAPTYTVNNNVLTITYAAPAEGKLYNGEEFIANATLSEKMFDLTLYNGDTQLVKQEGVYGGASYTYKLTGEYDESYTLKVKLTPWAVGEDEQEASTVAYTPTTALQIATPITLDSDYENVTVNWGAFVVPNENVTFQVFVLSKDNTRAIVWSSDDDLTGNSVKIPATEFEEGVAYDIKVVATWANGTADATEEFDGITGIDALSVDGDAVYFDLNGRQVVNPENGLYIRVANGKAQKMIIRK